MTGDTVTRYYEHCRVFECEKCRVLVVGKETADIEQCGLCAADLRKSRPIRILVLRIYKQFFDGDEPADDNGKLNITVENE